MPPRMRRVILLVVALICASDGASAQILEGRLKQIGESKVIKLAYRSDANPFSFVDPQGQPDGYTIDLCKFVVHSIERQLNAKLTIEWVPVDTKSRFDAVATGLADMECGSSTVSFERMAKVDFSSFIFMENTGLMVRANSGILNVGDMDGKKIAVIVATTNEIAVIKELQRRKLQASLVRVKDRREGMAALGSGTVDGFASDKLLLIGARMPIRHLIRCSRKTCPTNPLPSPCHAATRHFVSLSIGGYRNSIAVPKFWTSI